MSKPLWHGKNYYSLDAFLKNQFGEKVYKISLNGGFTCPNRDGTLGSRGCIFCSEGGSGDFAQSPSSSVSEQIEAGKRLLEQKTSAKKYIAYFQAFTNTYASVGLLRQKFTEAIRKPEICILSIATRPDCLNDEIYDLLYELNQIKPVWIELGLQTIHEKSADFIRRCYPLICYEKAVEQLKRRKITVITHLILGLPTETTSQMMESVRYLASYPVDGIKLQLLHVLKNTDLAAYYEKNPFEKFTLDSYCDFLIEAIRILPPSMVIHRLTGDAKRSLLISPAFSTDKRRILNTIHQRMQKNHYFQGDLF